MSESNTFNTSSPVWYTADGHWSAVCVCPSTESSSCWLSLFGLYLPAIKLEISVTQTQTNVKAHLFQVKLPIPSPPGYCCYSVFVCVCAGCCELSREILIWQVTSTSESPKDDIPLSSCDTLNKPWRLPRTVPYTFGNDTLDVDRMSDCV